MRSTNAPLAVLFLVNVLNYYDRQVLGALVEPLRHQFGLSDTQLALLPTLFTVLYAVAGLPLGRLSDTGSRKRLLAIGVAVWAGLTALGAAATSYAMLLATRLGVGIGEAVCAPAATSWIGDLVPERRRARALAGFMMAVPVGVMLSLAITGPVAQWYGWRIAVAVAALPAILLIPALRYLKEPAHGGATEDASPMLLARVPALWWIAASGAVVNSALYTFSYFLPAFLTRFHGVAVGKAGLWTGIGSGIAGILGAVAAGIFGAGRLRLAALAALAAAPAAFGAILLPPGNLASALCLAMLAYGLLQTYYGLVYSSLHDIVGPELRGSAMSAYLMVTYLGGASFGPLLTGRLSDYFARQSGAGAEAAKAIGLHQAMYVIPALCLLLAGVLWGGARSVAGRNGAVQGPEVGV
jgi:predicted MFS family arabinose efflux permease